MADEVVDTPFGKFLINPADCIGSTLKAGTVWDGPGFLQVIAREHGRLGEVGTTILDVGANIGAWTVWLAGQGAWRVIACEPVPETLRYLRANLDLNKAVCAERVVLIETAAAETFGTMDYTFVENDHGSTALTFQKGGRIPAVPLDTYQPLFGVRVSLIKVDAQGSDFAALLGLRQTIERDHPVIVFEWEPEMAARHGHVLVDAIAWLQVHGYQVIEWPSHKQNYLAIWQATPTPETTPRKEPPTP